MLNKLKEIYYKIKYNKYLSINNRVEQMILRNSYYESKQNNTLLYEYGFKVFSQHEEDGMLWYIYSLIGEGEKKCIEMCVGNGIESNTANLIVNHYWTGLLFDGDVKNVKAANAFYNRHANTRIYPPKIINTWITRDNINRLIADNGFNGDIDLFSLDVDGNDYYLLENLTIVSPRVIVLEVNHLLGYKAALTIPYDENFVCNFTDDGSDYAGASVRAFIKLLNKKGYCLVGLNRFATNAFFVRKDLMVSGLHEVDDISLYFKHPRVIYGMTTRYEKVKNKEWVSV